MFGLNKKIDVNEKQLCYVAIHDFDEFYGDIFEVFIISIKGSFFRNQYLIIYSDINDRIVVTKAEKRRWWDYLSDTIPSQVILVSVNEPIIKIEDRSSINKISEMWLKLKTKEKMIIANLLKS